MAITRFPNGISSFGGTVVQHGVTSVTGAGTITTGLDTVVAVNVSLGTALGTASNQVWTAMGTAHVAASGAASFIARSYNGLGNAATVAAPVNWIAYGTKA